MTLPDDYLVRRCIDHWVVVGPTGLFVVGRSDGDLDGSTRRATSMSHLLRTRLSDDLPWVPFVSALVVGDQDRHDLSCPVVDIHELGPVLQSGGRQIGDGALHMLRHHVPGAVQAIEFEQGASASL